MVHLLQEHVRIYSFAWFAYCKNKLEHIALPVSPTAMNRLEYLAVYGSPTARTGLNVQLVWFAYCKNRFEFTA